MTTLTTCKPLTRKPALIDIGAAQVILTNAIVFLLPPLLPIIQTQYGLSSNLSRHASQMVRLRAKVPKGWPAGVAGVQ
jgi:hypothetical protein